METTSKNPQETAEFASKFINSLKPKSNSASVVGLVGELGSGKTTFTQFAAKELGINDKITSPTFVILKKYPISKGKFKTFVHVDAYRLEDSKELSTLSFDDELQNPQNLIFIEWAEKVKNILPDDTVFIKFTHQGEDVRKIETTDTKIF